MFEVISQTQPVYILEAWSKDGRATKSQPAPKLNLRGRVFDKGELVIDAQGGEWWFGPRTPGTGGVWARMGYYAFTDLELGLTYLVHESDTRYID